MWTFDPICLDTHCSLIRDVEGIIRQVRFFQLEDTKERNGGAGSRS